MLKRPSLRVTTLQYLVYHQVLTMCFQYLQPGRSSRFGSARDIGRLNSRVCSYAAVIVAHTNSCNAVESWELKVKLASPGILRHQHEEVEVTSVNWQSQDAAATASHVLVSYRWHGIMYAVKFSQQLIYSTLVRCWDVATKSVLFRLPMDEW
jgi:hypothetical protein